MSDRQVVARILHGSHLFGTATERSDTDYKSVVIASREEILLGRVNWSSNEAGTSDSTRPNTSADVDDEVHDLARFAFLLAAGQPMALEMLFAPASFHAVAPGRAWHDLVSNSGRIVSREAGKFIGYCRRQALAYGLKGERVAAAEAALSALRSLVSSHGPRERLGPHIDGVIAAAASPHVGMEPRTMATGKVIQHLRIAGKMAASTVTLQDAVAIAEGVVAEYGRRARVAMEATGKDWKALSHALRIGYEAVELLTDGRITLPRPEAPRLLAVKNGEADADEVGEEIVGLLEKVEAAAASSTLPETADLALLDEIVIEHHGEAVAAAAPGPSCP